MVKQLTKQQKLQLAKQCVEITKWYRTQVGHCYEGYAEAQYKANMAKAKQLIAEVRKEVWVGKLNKFIFSFPKSITFHTVAI